MRNLLLITALLLLQNSSGLAQNHISRVSISASGTEADSWVMAPDISSDGRRVTFETSASTLLSDGRSSIVDAYVHDRAAGELRRASTSSKGVPGNANSIFSSISGNGRYVAFSSAADNLVSDDTNALNDIFVFDLFSSKLERVSLSSSGEQSDSASFLARLDETGRFVVF